MILPLPHNGTQQKVFDKTVAYIRSCQQLNGAILWFSEGKLDPWDHAEAAMALTVGGDLQGAKRAYHWLKNSQNTDGSWFAKYYQEHGPEQDNERNKIETNFVAYPATGVWHFYLVTGDQALVETMFPCIEKAIDFVLGLQTQEGDIQWAVSEAEALPKDALVTACASILRSLEAAVQLSKLVNKPKSGWVLAHQKLANALRNKPWRFDRTWESKARFSMDWFYPVLAGIYSQSESRLRLRRQWTTFVENGIGCRCVSDEPWVTVAESCELTLALIAAGEIAKAEQLYQWLAQWQDQDGGFWTGYSVRDKVIWPQEKTSWTAAATILAADALYHITPAAQLFTLPSTLLD